MKTHDDIDIIVDRQMKYIIKNSERFIKCFIAKTGCQPDEVMLVYKNGSIAFYPVDKRSNIGQLYSQIKELFKLNEQLLKENKYLRKELGFSENDTIL